jgi:hypothetical protein
MVRSRATAKKAGSWMERIIADHFASEVDDRIDRAVKRGQNDIGDISGLRFHGHKIAVEVKNTTKVELSKWAKEAEAERQNLGALAGLTIFKRYGKTAPGSQWVLMTVDDLVALMTLERKEQHEQGTTVEGTGRATSEAGTGREGGEKAGPVLPPPA